MIFQSTAPNHTHQDQDHQSHYHTPSSALAGLPYPGYYPNHPNMMLTDLHPAGGSPHHPYTGHHHPIGGQGQDPHLGHGADPGSYPPHGASGIHNGIGSASPCGNSTTVGNCVQWIIPRKKHEVGCQTIITHLDVYSIFAASLRCVAK